MKDYTRHADYRESDSGAPRCSVLTSEDGAPLFRPTADATTLRQARPIANNRVPFTAARDTASAEQSLSRLAVRPSRYLIIGMRGALLLVSALLLFSFVLIWSAWPADRRTGSSEATEPREEPTSSTRLSPGERPAPATIDVAFAHAGAAGPASGTSRGATGYDVNLHVLPDLDSPTYEILRAGQKARVAIARVQPREPGLIALIGPRTGKTLFASRRLVSIRVEQVELLEREEDRTARANGQ